MPAEHHCPKCASANIIFSKKRGAYVCEDCAHVLPEAPVAPLRIFLSYGHDGNEELVRRIKTDLEKRKHDVWFDKNEIKFGDDWRRAITDGILRSNSVLSFLSKHSTRDPGVCLDEIIIAIGAKGGNIQSILVESEKEILVPPSIGNIQWVDMHDWKVTHGVVSSVKDNDGNIYTVGDVTWEQWYQAKLTEIIRMVESDESRRFAEEIKALENHLKPTTSDFVSDSRIAQLLKKPLVGRKWLFEAVEKWRTTAERDARLFWLMGAPGIGKSAFAAHLAHEYGRGTVIAVQFCDWKKPDHRDACRIIRTLAFQIATRLPDYRKLLLTLPILTELDRKNSAELFDGLLTNPLKLSITGGRERYLIVIDALDEAGGDGRNELVEVLARYAGQLPDWIGLVVTSRPEFDVTTPFQTLKPFPFKADSNDNKNDIRKYIAGELETQLKNCTDADRLVEQILEKSEGVFLYVESFCADIRKNFLSLDRPNEFPQGLAGKFYMDFQRYFPDLEIFRKEVRPALRATLAAREPLPVKILQRLFNWQDEDLRDFIRPLASLFPVTMDAGHKVIKPYHKSIADWLGDEAKSGSYFISTLEGQLLLAEQGWREFREMISDMGRYYLRNLPWHLVNAGRPEDIAELLNSREFVARLREEDHLLPLMVLAAQLLSTKQLSTTQEYDVLQTSLLKISENQPRQKYNSRRLPVYLVLDCSESMSGEPIRALREALSSLIQNLRDDPMALETVYLSVITFNNTAQQVVPLTDLISFREPWLEACGTTALGNALKVLRLSIDKEVVKQSTTQKADWKPFILIMTGGSPNDDWEDEADRLHKLNVGNIVACAAGEAADEQVLRRITDNVIMLDDIQPHTLKQFFNWCSSSIKTPTLNH